MFFLWRETDNIFSSQYVDDLSYIFECFTVYKFSLQNNVLSAF
jgi:hypothetical protein